MNKGVEPASVASVARLVDRFAGRFDPGSIAAARRVAALAEVEMLIVLFDGQSPELARALLRLRDCLNAQAQCRNVAKSSSAATRSLSALLKRLVALSLTGAALSSAVPAAATIPAVSVGGTVLNPLTQQNETVVQVFGSPGYAVLTNSNNVILLAQTVGDTYTDVGSGKLLTVTAVSTTTVGGKTYATGVTVTDANSIATDLSVVNDASKSSGGGIRGANASGSVPVTFPTAAGDVNQITRVEYGVSGGSGSDGWGIRVCLFGLCTPSIGMLPGNGGDGAAGPPISVSVPQSYGTITTVSDKLSGIIAASIGGNGGNGGSGAGIGVSAGTGGAAGAGGTVKVTNYATIVTSGSESDGIFAKSMAGIGGTGGTCYFWCDGGQGGIAAQGGSASVVNFGNISTLKDSSVGILVQSLGGNSGNGGSSYGVVGTAGYGSVGGDGGDASAENGGTIVTRGASAHGIEVQSIGGTGGNSGNSLGFAAFGNDAGGAGNGGLAKIRLLSTSSITTYGNEAHGAFAQSIGGGGGSTGWSGSLGLSLGGGAGSGGIGGAAEIDADDGSYIHTAGAGSYGIFVESVGGNGGTAGGSGSAIFTLGGTGGSGNNGGSATLISGATIITEGKDARGIFVQSVGGGGGNANISGALVSLGANSPDDQGPAGGDGGAVQVTLDAASSVITKGKGADAIFAQSVGGGGGAGATSGGLVALGGKGGSGGQGGNVTVGNAGSIQTAGNFARGIFAQSVGGGGGSGGDSGGLLAIGGAGSIASKGGYVTVSNSGSIVTTGNRSSAIQAQSIGGGGGDGGSTGGLLAIGGTGAGGGAGGVVTANLSGILQTSGNDSHGLFAQSVGGGGGNGGSSTSLSAFAGFSLGGVGESGGIGGDVTLNMTKRAVVVDGITTMFDPLILTSGERSRAIYVQSVGGGGGSGGFAVQSTGGAFGSAAISLGGRGGKGGNGGTVGVHGDANIFTSGNFSEGLFAQSVGGGGGAGGASIAASISAGVGFSGSFSLSLGGSGGDGGQGGVVTVDSGGNIVTQGALSTGFLAQSVGGGGGKGGYSVSIAGAGSDGVALSGAFGIGGAGGAGGNGGQVTATFNGDISTGGSNRSGTDSAGYIAQSIGGGGGTGGYNAAASLGLGGAASLGGAIGLGGSGGAGGNGGIVIASVGGPVLTTGDRSTGILAQSVGGGGGSGGVNVSGSIAVSSKASGAVSVGLGGSGGGGGDGGNVQASAQNIRTLGDESIAFVAQSLGGGGGSGGFNVSGGIALSAEIAGAVNIGFGGSGGSGGSAGSVSARLDGTAVTSGNKSDGILVQSIGGGGGSGGFDVAGGISVAKSGAGNVSVGIGGIGGKGGASGAVSLDVNQQSAQPSNQLVAAVTHGDGSAGIVVQSIGGGGGAGGFDVSGGLALSNQGAGNVALGLGGAGGSGSAGNNVVARIAGSIATMGNESGGLLLQSAGGGGGAGGFNVSGGVSLSRGASGNAMVGIGGYGGSGGDGASVDGTIVGDIATIGDQSYGVTLESLGGSGGTGGFNITGGVALSLGDSGAGNIGVGIGGFGGGGGNASTVTGSILSNVSTSGSEAHGLLLQSVGGGGGDGGMNITGGVAFSRGTDGTIGFGLGGFGGDGGNGEAISAILSGNVTTLGAKSFGAMLQSVGGAGGAGALDVTGGLDITAGKASAVSLGVGIGGFGGGGGGAASVNASVSGTYVTSGRESDGVVAQSVGGGGGAGGVNVTGSITFTKGSGAAGAASIGLGGFGGSGGASGAVTLNRTGNTTTGGALSDGIVVQSVGGGGGLGGINIAGSVGSSTEGNAVGVAVGMGGFGGAGGNGAAVSATINGSVLATGIGSVESWNPGEIQTDDGHSFTVANATRKLDGSNGVLVESIGGGGGSGGINISGAVAGYKADGSTGRALALGIGGFGGQGGNGGDVSVVIAASPGAAARLQVEGAGDDKSAVSISSIGGGGGSGGINVSGGISSNGQVVAGVGGFGGSGGTGGIVTANVDADLFASGNRANGLLVQSLGGGGGNGAINISGGLKPLAGKDPTLAFGVGGFGGTGNVSSAVSAVQDGQIVVEGLGSHGILVQSVGGGGGAGGLDVVASINRSDGQRRLDGVALSVGIGGVGGTGADGASATLISAGNIFMNTMFGTDAWGKPALTATDGAGKAAGILVQSVGGGGGAGGINVVGAASQKGSPAAIGVGGSGGAAGNGGDVSVDRGFRLVDGVEIASRSLINTFGDGSAGLIAQSIGGGGGAAGIDLVFAGSKKTDAGERESAIVAVGGDGASAGNGGDVRVRQSGNIQTNGYGSDGILAQSIAKGGGQAAINIGAGSTKNARSVDLAIGGSPGDGGSAGKVTVVHDGTIVTHGGASSAIVAQSIAGGGGSVAKNELKVSGTTDSAQILVGRDGGRGGSASLVTVEAAGDLSTDGDDSSGIVAQSIGGSGGTSGTISATLTEQQPSDGGEDQSASSDSQAVSIGLAGGDGGRAGEVTVLNAANIVTAGARARGIVAQSIGGDGGIAGGSSGALGGSDTAISLAVGGSGGQGSSAAAVNVANGGVIETLGDQADGILAQSIGGGGGVGGAFSVEDDGKGAGDDSTKVSMGIGGSGGSGAAGGNVAVTNSGTIATQGLLSFGIRAQSIGGTGGVGGAATTKVALGANQSNTSLDVTIGGSGGTGEKGGSVSVTNSGLIYTMGASAAGISANSIGGGGGDAGYVKDNAKAGLSQSSTNRLAIDIGGSGGSGGAGGGVHVSNDATGRIVTEGTAAYGILAQSLGGGGGNSSSILSLSKLKGTGDTASVSMSIGARGGDGNIGGAVSVDNYGAIQTSGAGANGIFAQSIGGGGGNGGVVLDGNLVLGKGNAQSLALGGFGGSGGDGGAITVINAGTILTIGKFANGIVAQSIGGGGGNAGLGVALSNDLQTTVLSNSLSAILGATLGTGGGGKGGDVSVTNSGDITVLGDGAQAIVASSINGGGGSIDLDLRKLSGSKTASATTPDPLVVARAGAAQTSGSVSGNVHVTSSGTIGAAGANSVGEDLKSIGGGGGTIAIDAELVTPTDDTEGQAPIDLEIDLGSTGGADNAASGIISEHSGSIVTEGFGSPGLLIQSIGGGGGRAYADLEGQQSLTGMFSISLGASGSWTSSGGNIDRRQDGLIATSGNYAPAAIVQSIGGGGGMLLLGLPGQPAQQANFVPAAAPGQSGEIAVPPPLSVALGASGGTSNDGGDVRASFHGGIQSTGNYSNALQVQSIGGGGGVAAFSGGVGTSITLGGRNGAGGSGGAIDVVNDGAIYTGGTGSSGLFLQSIGGGGGAIVGELGKVDLLLSPANAGDGGSIRLTQSGDVMARGDRSFGIFAQSVAGGGGFVEGQFSGSAGGLGTAGTINLAVHGSVLALGADSTAIGAQSVGAVGTGSDILVSVTGDVRGGSGAGMGIWLDGGADNAVDSKGSLSAISTVAMRAGAGNDRFLNEGLAVGNFYLGGGTNALTNAAGATFVTIDTLELQDGLGSTGAFTNDGNLYLGQSASRYPIDLLAGEKLSAPPSQISPALDFLHGTDIISIVRLDGSFVQRASGSSFFDIAFGPYASDRVNVTGDATVAGTANITLTWLENNHPVPLFATGGKGIDEGLKVPGTIALNYKVLSGTEGIELAFDSNFGQRFLNANEQSLGHSMDSALQVGNAAGLGRLLALVGNLSAGQEQLYRDIFDELDPEALLAPSLVQFDAASTFGTRVFGCPATVSVRGRTCLWGETGLNGLSRGSHRGDYRFTNPTSVRLRGGVDRQLGNGWSVGAAVGYDDLGIGRFETDRAYTSGNGVHVGVGVQKTFGTDQNGLASLMLSAGTQNNRVDRSQKVFVAGVGHSSFKTSYLQAAFRLGYTFGTGIVFARPEVDGSIISLDQHGFTESGLAGLGMIGLSDKHAIQTLSPQLMLGMNISPMACLSISGGGVFHNKGYIAHPFRFIGADPQSDAAIITTRFDESALTAGAKLQLIGSDRLKFDIGYYGEFGKSIRSQTANAEVKFLF